MLLTLYDKFFSGDQEDNLQEGRERDDGESKNWTLHIIKSANKIKKKKIKESSS